MDAVKHGAPSEDFARGELVKMVTQGWVSRVTLGIENTIRASFAGDQVLRSVMTRDEIQRRFRICVRGFCIMRRDLGWAVPRILDELPRFLRCELDAMAWSPDEHRGSWTSETREVGEVDGDDLVIPSELPPGIDLDAGDPAVG